MPTFVFGPFMLDTATRQLTRAGEPVPLTAKVFDTLELLIRASGDTVTRETFVTQLWPDTVVEERNLTVNISTLRKALGAGREVDYIATVPRQGYRLTAPVRIVEIEAEASSRPHTPPSGDLTDDSARGAPLSGVPRELTERWSPQRARVAFVLGALVVGTSLGAIMWRGEAMPSPMHAVGGGRVSVAVLPFTTAGEGLGDQGLGLGLADGVIAHLSTISEIDVRPIGAVASYGSGSDPVAVGRQLGVAQVIDGSVLHDGRTARVSARIIDVASGATRWNERFERPFEDRQELRGTVAADVAATLVRLVYIERTWSGVSKRPANDDAYRAYLEAMDHMNRHTDGEFERAVAAFQRTVALDPEYAPGWAGLARAYRMQGFAPGNRPAQVMDLARAAAERAVRVNDRLAEAHTALGIIRYTYDWDWADAEREFELAVAVDPQSQDALGWLGGFQIDLGRYDEGMETLRRSRALNPLSPTYTQTLAVALWRTGRIDEALGMLKEASRARMTSAEPHWLRAHILDQAERPDEAVEARRLAVRASGDHAYSAALEIAAGKGYRAVVEQELQLRLDRHELDDAAALQVVLGRYADAMTILETCADEYCTGVGAFATSASYRPLHGEPRFEALLARVKLGGFAAEGPP